MKKKDQRQSSRTLTFHTLTRGVNPLLRVYFKEAPLATASLMFPTK